jgi:hypothetical protein
MDEVKIIYGTKGCHKCEKAKQKFPTAQYIDIVSVPKTEYELLIDKARLANQTSFPLMLDEKENLILHYKAGI